MRRRDFLTVTVASATVAATGAASAASVWQTREATQFSRTRFVAWLNHEFAVTGHGALRALPATLVAVQEGPVHPGMEQFSVLFRSAAALPTGLCQLSHVDGTQFSLYLDAASGDASETLRCATFGLLEQQHV